ncbi:hypothetical protein GCM10007876_23210 [Litoribrevibacter albus]|uniref:ABC transporter substrate-binding protein n=1 Tax=Litoribrevibacter albus TaxID=1473156 RepID=A0AA37W6A5_9GAMM|nr:hypothetical protein GCM10007876_23210 [Litoribrevibacter albus]
MEHLQVIYICETPSESDIEEQAFLLPIPSPIDQLNIARAIISGDIEIAVIYSRKSEIQYKYLETNKHESIRISGYKSYGSLKFDQQVKDVIKQNDAVLALADESIFNESTQRALMLNTYRERRPVFGPNESFVVSGSIATLCITEEDIAKSAIRLIKSFEETEYLPGIYFPISPKIVTNNTAAKTFSLKLPDDEIIGKKILQASLGDKVNEF